ncbi:MAG: DUF4388 domain-containing protein [bacterium]|nr:MAG: DUF4388 domain-containing protein [bacterium]
MSAGKDLNQVSGSGTILDPSMSLVGRLEDLSLGEILQIVSLSKRSGLLRLESPEGKANIFIRAGKVIYAARSDEKEGVLSLLVHHGLIETGQLESLRPILESTSSVSQFRDMLTDRLGISPDSFQQVLRKRVEELVYSLFVWEEGTFSFQLIEDEMNHPLLVRIVPFFLDDGIGAQFLVMEGARRKDELGRQSPSERNHVANGPPAATVQVQESWEQEFEEQLAGEKETAETEERFQREMEFFEIPGSFPPLPAAIAPTILTVGIGGTLAASLTGPLRDRGVELLSEEEGAEALTRIQKLRQQRKDPYLLIDLEATGITDDRILGGLEIISTLWDLGIALPVGLVRRRDLPARLLERLSSVPGVRILDMSDPSREAMLPGAVLDALGELLAPRAEDGGAAGHEPPPAPEPAGGVDVTGAGEQYYDIQQELSRDLEGIDLPFEGLEETPETVHQAPADPHMARLGAFVSELNRQEISGEITLLALRFASTLVSRAVLFLVRREDMRGLGQFGVDLGEGEDADAVVRSLTLSTGADSVFQKVAHSKQSYKGPPTGSQTEENLFDALGGGVPDEIYVGPIVSMGKVAVLLYGDDFPGKQGLEPTHTLDIFLSHVGLALDRAFLEMKLKAQRS